jgi:dipeptidyl aminopeptidase/acylaminoacyl peptidase
VENNIFLKRGMAVLSLDGPGHGESRIRGSQRWQISEETGDNYSEAGYAAVEALAAREDIDLGRIGVFGISQGSYWAPIMAARDKRIRACVCMMGSFYEQGFDIGQPTFKENLMYMTGFSEESEVDRLIPRITLDGMEGEVESSLLVLHGEFDELTPADDAERFIARAVSAAERELVIYEDEFHPLGGVCPEAFAKAADWLAQRLEAPAG